MKKLFAQVVLATLTVLFGVDAATDVYHEEKHEIPAIFQSTNTSIPLPVSVSASGPSSSVPTQTTSAPVPTSTQQPKEPSDGSTSLKGLVAAISAALLIAVGSAPPIPPLTGGTSNVASDAMVQRQSRQVQVRVPVPNFPAHDLADSFNVVADELRELFVRKLPETSARALVIEELRFSVVGGELYLRVQFTIRLDIRAVSEVTSDLLRRLQDAGSDLMMEKLAAIGALKRDTPMLEWDDAVRIDVRRQVAQLKDGNTRAADRVNGRDDG